MDIKIGILMTRTSGSLRDYLRLRAASFRAIEDPDQRYFTVRSTVLDYFKSKQVYQRPSVPLPSASTTNAKGNMGPAPMEVDVVYKGTSPYNKGKENGKRMTTPFGKGSGKSFGNGFSKGGKGKGQTFTSVESLRAKARRS